MDVINKPQSDLTVYGDYNQRRLRWSNESMASILDVALIEFSGKREREQLHIRIPIKKDGVQYLLALKNYSQTKEQVTDYMWKTSQELKDVEPLNVICVNIPDDMDAQTARELIVQKISYFANSDDVVGCFELKPREGGQSFEEFTMYTIAHALFDMFTKQSELTNPAIMELELQQIRERLKWINDNAPWLFLDCMAVSLVHGAFVLEGQQHEKLRFVEYVATLFTQVYSDARSDILDLLNNSPEMSRYGIQGLISDINNN